MAKYRNIILALIPVLLVVVVLLIYPELLNQTAGVFLIVVAIGFAIGVLAIFMRRR
jgi:Flp pilus assembly protein TadB